MRKLVGRNVDRECDRNDIVETSWVEFLTEVAQHILPEEQVRSRAYFLWCAKGEPAGPPDEDWHRAERELLAELILDPLALMDSIVEERRAVYSLQGGELSPACPRVYRYVDIAAFSKHNFRPPTFPHVHQVGPNDLGFSKLSSWINSGFVGASSMARTTLGAPGRPVWCTDRSLIPGRTAEDVRNTLRLKHVDGGFLVEISYSMDTLRRHGESLHAPTVLDASVSGPRNWIFLKNRLPGTGPDWGYTGRVTPDRILEQGPPEAVHAPFKIDDNDAEEMTLRSVGPIGSSFPHVDYELTFNNSNA